MVNPIVLPFLKNGIGGNRLLTAGGKLGVEITREALNIYRQQAQKRGVDWPRLNWLITTVHSLLDQIYSGDINIVPHFRWSSMRKILSHITEEEMMLLMKEGEVATWPELRAIETCTKISRALDDILERFERGDLKPVRAARRRPKRPAERKAPAKKAKTVKKSEGRPGDATPETAVSNRAA
jgi:TAG lipase/steryl ester hydrolase/phospholipase A2/LPA acyltransferase